MENEKEMHRTVKRCTTYAEGKTCRTKQKRRMIAIDRARRG